MSQTGQDMFVLKDKSIDGILRPKNSYESWKVWLNYTQTQFLQLHKMTKIKVINEEY